MSKPQPGDVQLRAWRAFLTAHARVTEALGRELVQERQLPLSWYDVLVQLFEAPEQRLRMHGLASAVLLSRAGLTRLVDRMTAAGLVERVPCEDDRRGTYVALTPSGQRTLRTAAPTHMRGVEEHFGSFLTRDEAAALESVLTRIASAIRSS